MKALALMVSAFLAVTLHATLGHAQAQMCASEYGACMDRCATMGQSPTQGRCFVACQKSNDTCAAKVYGSWRAPFGTNAEKGEEALAQEAEPEQR